MFIFVLSEGALFSVGTAAAFEFTALPDAIPNLRVVAGALV